MSAWVRLVATLFVAALVSCGQATAPSATEAPLGPPGADNRPRLALVIGIGDYHDDSLDLPNPVRDAELMARSLRAVGFQMPVPVAKNVTREQLAAALTNFARAVHGAGDDAIGLIYFAGHGMQVNGINYLLPADARRPTDVPDEPSLLRRELSTAFLPAEELLTVLGSRQNGASILILDACRDNPLTRSIRPRVRGDGAPTPQGLYDMSRATGVLIAYATTPGEFALDGSGRNSPYAEALASEIMRGGTVYDVFNRVRGRVEDLPGEQSPRETNGLRGSSQFCFGACSGTSTGAGAQVASDEELEALAANEEASQPGLEAQTSTQEMVPPPVQTTQQQQRESPARETFQTAREALEIEFVRREYDNSTEMHAYNFTYRVNNRSSRPIRFQLSAEGGYYRDCQESPSNYVRERTYSQDGQVSAGGTSQVVLTIGPTRLVPRRRCPGLRPDDAYPLRYSPEDFLTSVEWQ